MSYVLYVVGYLIVIGGLIYGAVLLHVPTQWIVVGSVVLVSIAEPPGISTKLQSPTSSARD